MHPEQSIDSRAVGDQLEDVINDLPPHELKLDEIIQRVGDEGLLLLSALLTVIFLIPISLPGISTVFGAAILLVGISRLLHRPLWLPKRVRERRVSTQRLRPALQRGLKWVRRLEKISRHHRLAMLSEGPGITAVNNVGFIIGALLLMAPFGFVPLSNTLPGIALMFFSIGLMQRDGLAILLGHIVNVASTIYFGVLFVSGGAVVKEILQKFLG